MFGKNISEILDFRLRNAEKIRGSDDGLQLSHCRDMMLLITPLSMSTINHDSKEKKPRAQQAWSWSRHAREVISIERASNLDQKLPRGLQKLTIAMNFL